MIKVEEIHSLNGSTFFNTNDIITLSSVGEMKTADGRIITITGGGVTTPVTNNPIAKTDIGNVTEDNSISQVTGNVLTGTGSATADIVGDNGPLIVVGIVAGNSNENSSLNINQIINGTYGSITLNASGDYIYKLDNVNNATDNLISGQTVNDTFTYTIKDSKNNFSRANIIINISGSDDNRPSVTIVDNNGNEAGNFSIDDLQILTNASFVIGSVTPLLNIKINSTTINISTLQNSNSTNININTPKGILTIIGYNTTTGSVTFNYEPTVSMNTLDIITIEVTDTNNFKSNSAMGINITHIDLVETEDSLIEIQSSTIDSLQGNVMELVQDVGQSGWNKFQPVITQQDFSLVTSSVDSMSVKKIKFNIRSAGYQLVKILLYELGSDTPIEFNRIDSKTLNLVSDSSNILNIVSNGFMLVDNANYELSNIFNTAKMPTTSATGWFALTAASDTNSAFEATFSIPKDIASIRIYRCGTTTTTFNGGNDPYDVEVIDNAGSSKSFEVPKLNDTLFTSVANYISGSLGAEPINLSPEDKKYNFNFSYSFDNITFTDITPLDQIAIENTVSNLWTYENTYNIINTPNDNQRSIFIKVPDTDIQFLKNIKIKTWYLL